MYTTIIFLLLCLIEGVIFYLKWDQAQEYKEMTHDVAVATGVENNRKYKAAVRFMAKVSGIGTIIMLVIGVLLLFVNFIIALILGGILALIF
jgi:uncharacterized membrane protein YkgB